MPRRRALSLALAAIAFLVVSALLARVLSLEGAERGAITALLHDEVRGDAAAATARLSGCRGGSACAAHVRLTVASILARLAREGGADASIRARDRGAVAVLQLVPSAGFTPGGSTGVARVAWRTGRGRPVVQCVRVRRAGDALSGLRIELLAVSAPIRGDAECPPSF